jgi:hypothetical protein
MVLDGEEDGSLTKAPSATILREGRCYYLMKSNPFRSLLRSAQRSAYGRTYII